MHHCERGRYASDLLQCNFNEQKRYKEDLLKLQLEENISKGSNILLNGFIPIFENTSRFAQNFANTIHTTYV